MDKNDSMNFYRSRSLSNRATENLIVDAAVCQGIVPDAVRYDLHSGEIAGIIKSTSGNVFYFNFDTKTNTFSTSVVDSFTTHNAEYIFSKSTHGFDMEKSDEEDLEDEEKAQGAGTQGSAQPATVTEAQAVAQQNRLMTEQHPGAAIGMTPDREDRGRQWHQETVKSLDFLGESIQKSVEQYFPTINESEKQFLVEVLGRSPEDVEDGDTNMTPIQKVTYKKWLTKSVSKDYKPLNTWLAKH